MTISIFRFATFLTTLICVKKIFGTEEIYTVPELQGFPKYGESIHRSYKNEMVKKMGKNFGNLRSLSSFDTIFSNNGNNPNDQIFSNKNGNYDLTDTIPSYALESDTSHFRSIDSGSNESNPLFFQKKFRNFDNFRNNNEYLFYDWGPNPKIWGSVKQRKKENGGVITPKSKYLNTRDRGGYGWHSNQNLWGKRRESTSIPDKINRTPYDDSINDKIRMKLNIIPLRSIDGVPVMENQINLEQTNEMKSQLGHMNPILSRESGNLWDSRERRGKLENDRSFYNEESENAGERSFSKNNQNLVLDQRLKPSDEKTIREHKLNKVLNLFQQFLNNKKDDSEHYYLKPQRLRSSGNFEGFRGKKGIDKLFQNLGNLSGTFFTPRG